MSAKFGLLNLLSSLAYYVLLVSFGCHTLWVASDRRIVTFGCDVLESIEFNVLALSTSIELVIVRACGFCFSTHVGFSFVRYVFKF